MGPADQKAGRQPATAASPRIIRHSLSRPHGVSLFAAQRRDRAGGGRPRQRDRAAVACLACPDPARCLAGAAACQRRGGQASRPSAGCRVWLRPFGKLEPSRRAERSAANSPVGTSAAAPRARPPEVRTQAFTAPGQRSVRTSHPPRIAAGSDRSAACHCGHPARPATTSHADPHARGGVQAPGTETCSNTRPDAMSRTMPALQPAHRRNLPATSGPVLRSQDSGNPGRAALETNVTSGPERTVREDRYRQGSRPSAARHGTGLAGAIRRAGARA